MKKIAQILSKLFYSLPIRLVIRQFQHHKSVLFFWILLVGIISGAIAKNLGGAYLFLEPEYMGLESFWSLFIVGSALGGFLFAYMITIYINESYRFHFIAYTQYPFYVLAFNNLIVPGLFLTWYFYSFISYHTSLSGGFTWEVAEKIAGLTTGMLAVFLISATYFFANRTIIHFYGSKLAENLASNNSKHNRKVILDKARESFRQKQRADYYFLFPLQVQRVNSLKYGELRQVVGVLNQHHGKLLLFQVIIFLLIAVLGLLEANPRFQIPAGASFILILSLILMVIGAIRFWFRRSSWMTVAAIAALFILYNQTDSFRERNHAFGLNYDAEPVAYTMENLGTLQDQEFYQSDRELTIDMLNNWRKNYEENFGTHRKPKAVFVTASGGGLRSTYWSFMVLQYIDSLTNGQLGDGVRLMTGASGGMFGLTYYRELYLRKKMGEIDKIYDPLYRERISKDLLNPVIFNMFTDFLLPNRSVQFGSREYDRERGYAFDRQVALNLPEFKNRRLGDYKEWEQKGLIPQVILSPTIINQGRQLYISSNPVSYLTKPGQISTLFKTRVKGVEFNRFFSNHNPDSLWFITALRMNATFPIVLPIVELPCEPLMEIMDAGAVDNYGSLSSIRYLYEFRDWFAENTSGVIFLQIRDNAPEDPIKEPYKDHAFSQLAAPLGGGYYSMAQAKDINSDYLLESLTEWYDGQLEVVPVVYPRETSDPVSLSWHLTRREKKTMEANLCTPQNERSFQTIKQLFHPDLVAAQ